jgi:O-antigen/teichoic acid export membrane protein
MNARFFKILGSTFASRLLMAAANYGLFWLLSHQLSIDTLGGYSLLMNIFLMVQLLPLLGLAIPLQRRASTHPQELPQEVSNALAFAAPVSLLLMCGIGLAGWGYAPALHLPFWLVGASVLPSAWVLVAECTLMGRERMNVIARVQLGEAALRLVGVLYVVHLGHGLVGAFSVFLAMRVLTALAYARVSDVPRPRWSLLNRTLQRRNLAELPVFLGIAVLAALAARADVILLSRLGSLSDVGIYASASRLYDAALMLPTVAAIMVMPLLARQFQSDRQAFGHTLQLTLRFALGVGLVLALSVAALATPIIHLLYRPELAAAAPALRWLILGAVLMTLDQLLSSTMLAAEAQRQDLLTLIVAVASLLLGFVVLVPLYGASGAAAAVPLALLARVVWRLRWAVPELALTQLPAHLARLAAAGLLGGAGLMLGLQWHALAAWALALLAYAAGLRLAGVIDNHPLRQWHSWRARLASTANDAAN